MKNTKIPRFGFLDDNFEESPFEKIRTKKNNDERIPRERRSIENKDGFKCRSCKSWVSATREVCGVNHRNHCPFCLVSLHVDQAKAGDRRSNCWSRMEAIGLTFKKTIKRYAQERPGELMLIHRCTGCGKIDINRIAADDNPELLYALCKVSLNITGELSGKLAGQNISPLDAGGFNAAYAQIYGRVPIEVDLAGIKVNALIRE
jgi:hypothetical protein